MIYFVSFYLFALINFTSNLKINIIIRHNQSLFHSDIAFIAGICSTDLFCHLVCHINYLGSYSILIYSTGLYYYRKRVQFYQKVIPSHFHEPKTSFTHWTSHTCLHCQKPYTDISASRIQIFVTLSAPLLLHTIACYWSAQQQLLPCFSRLTFFCSFLYRLLVCFFSVIIACVVSAVVCSVAAIVVLLFLLSELSSRCTE